MPGKIFSTKLAVGIAITLFVGGGFYSVWRHQKLVAQPVAEISIDQQTQPRFQPVPVVPKATKKTAKAKSASLLAQALPVPVPQIAPSVSSGQVSAPVPAPAEPLSQPALTTPTNDTQPQATSDQVQPNPTPAPAPAPEPIVPVNSNPPPPSEPTPVPTPADPARILISEILFNPASSDIGKEFVELYNAGGTDASLKDWSLLLQNATSSPTPSSLAKFGSKSGEILTIKAHGFLLIGLNSYNQSPAGDIVRSISLPNTSSTIYLKDGSGQQIDAVSYDGALPEGDSVARENYTGDFTAQTMPTPQNSQSPTAP